MLTSKYKKSSYSGNGGCAFARRNADGNIELADGKDWSKQPLVFTTREWEAFLAGVKNGEFNLD
jgi:hypothetical protein